MFHTKLCDLLGIKYPIIQGALGGAGGPRLVAAVSNAGGLGVLATWGLTIDELRADIAQTRALTDKPFGVNIVPIGPAFTRNRAKTIIEEGVTIVTTGRGDPTTPIVSLLKEHGAKVLPVVPTVRHALRLEAEGADAIIASGSEAGGHVGTVASLALIPQVVDAVNIPVVAAGGIADARGFVTALALGACGIQMGTRFLASHESIADLRQKQQVLEASEEDTLVTTILTGKPVRVIKTPGLEEWLRHRQEEATHEAGPMSRSEREDTGYIGVAAGQISGMIRSIESAEDIITRVIEEAREICRRLASSGDIF